ncbi:hypothetical protein OGAPHI_003921 [Ogataea philodendri]|uniref:SPT2 chromatin protein n=1 Tax=Ogataea philodendri TaxID=1378263 RepID=A0A9P8T4A4_9ASCO|nr:uncharacterized protein OGAPHI_003921 [Ogataea philodendri]KAH3665733.1 hypothetical protein OGAPHI_003921 [Ogataea philodendri]
MSFSSLLTQITGKDKARPFVETGKTGKQDPSGGVSRSTASGTPVRGSGTNTKKQTTTLLNKVAPDPAVQRLKEARRLEKQREEDSKKQKRVETLRKMDKQRERERLASKGRPVPVSSKKTPEPAPKRAPLPKMSFKELMSRAEGVDPKKLAYAPIKLEATKKNVKTRPERKFAQPSAALQKKLGKKPTKEKPRVPVASSRKEPVQKKDTFGIEADSEDEEESYYQEYDDLDDFVVDDVRERSRDYNSDEIWGLFNRGKKRQYQDYDDDDMEATGADIFEEEERALRQARLDDKREELLEQKRKEQKLKRLHGK